MNILFWLLISPALVICLITLIVLYLWKPRTQYKTNVAIEVVTTAIGILFLAYTVQLILWGLGISF